MKFLLLLSPLLSICIFFFLLPFGSYFFKKPWSDLQGLYELVSTCFPKASLPIAHCPSHITNLDYAGAFAFLHIVPFCLENSFLPSILCLATQDPSGLSLNIYFLREAFSDSPLPPASIVPKHLVLFLHANITTGTYLCDIFLLNTFFPAGLQVLWSEPCLFFSLIFTKDMVCVF